MAESRKQKLIDLGAEALAEDLLTIAVHSDEDEILRKIEDSDGIV